MSNPKKASIVVAITSLAAIAVFLMLTKTTDHKRSDELLSPRSAEFYAAQKAQNDQYWNSVNLDENQDTSSQTTIATMCFSLTTDRHITLSHTESDETGCTYRADIQRPRARLLITHRPATQTLDADSAVMLRRSKPEVYAEYPVNFSRAQERRRFISADDHVTFLLIEDSLVVIALSDFATTSDSIPDLADEILTQLELH